MLLLWMWLHLPRVRLQIRRPEDILFSWQMSVNRIQLQQSQMGGGRYMRDLPMAHQPGRGDCDGAELEV
jgi:hypothetical protein